MEKNKVKSLWKKNQPTRFLKFQAHFFSLKRTPNSLGLCHGTDANRNWGYQWNTGGSSGNGCSDTYHGPEAFSEVENRYITIICIV